MEGQEIAFWLMMGFSCLVGIFIGYLMFSPRRSSAPRDDTFEHQHFDEDVDQATSSELDPDTVPTREPWLTDKETLREQARERAMVRMQEHSKRVRQESEAAKQGRQVAVNTDADVKANASLPDEPVQPFFDPDTIKEWDQVTPKSGRRKPGTWVKATTD